jgi:hypothetical protein
MLMAFLIRPLSLKATDANDNLYASYSLGFDYSSIGATMPALKSKMIIPYRASDTTGVGV